MEVEMSKVRGPDGKLYKLQEGEVYEAPENKGKNKKKKVPSQPGKMTPDPSGANITPDDHGANITPDDHGAHITPDDHGAQIRPKGNHKKPRP
jgi:hypothetical protein